ncbi:ribonuclease P protein component [Thermanaerosceptrum fracticalcis]|uniref:Ribonuclease P protein component n=1 Tax=Thermanaerosceptrum fracticalcis TaxID=1712410 RepID=A0A7G6E569_THEFR|nr:ribonuclease P protein component [Thermanaerosceptrum fracticalcis]
MQLLPRRFRLKKKGDFKKTYYQGKSLANSYLVLYSFKRPENKESRLGFSVSKKVGKAVERNKIKRRLREAAKLHLHELKVPFDIIFIARPKIKGISFSDVEKNMVALLQRAHLLKKDE